MRSETNLPNYDDSSSDEEKKKVAQIEEAKSMVCPNCQEEVSMEQAAAHTVMCYRNSTKCKVCHKVILKTKKKEHLQ